MARVILNPSLFPFQFVSGLGGGGAGGIVDPYSTKTYREMLKNRLTKLEGTNCGKIFAKYFDLSIFRKKSQNLNFYDARPTSFFANFTEDQVVDNGRDSKLYKPTGDDGGTTGVTSLHSIIVLTRARNGVSWFCDDTTLTDQPGRGLVPRDSSRQ
jgi:hypothetical protein